VVERLVLTRLRRDAFRGIEQVAGQRLLRCFEQRGQPDRERGSHGLLYVPCYHPCCCLMQSILVGDEAKRERKERLVIVVLTKIRSVRVEMYVKRAVTGSETRCRIGEEVVRTGSLYTKAY